MPGKGLFLARRVTRDAALALLRPLDRDRLIPGNVWHGGRRGQWYAGAWEVVRMARASRTFRIFVSSTFSDLKEERNAL